MKKSQDEKTETYVQRQDLIIVHKKIKIFFVVKSIIISVVIEL